MTTSKSSSTLPTTAETRTSFKSIVQLLRAVEPRFRLGVVINSANTVLPPTAGDFSVVFGAFQTNYSFSRFLTLSTLLQMHTANTQAASANIRLRWNYRPDSDLFVIYTAGQRFASLVATNPQQFYENRFAIKFTYSWRP
jgi:hypothetical protein